MYRDLDRNSDLESAALAELSRRGRQVTSWSVRITSVLMVAAAAIATAYTFVTAGPTSISENLVAHSMSAIAIVLLVTAGLGAWLHRLFLRRAVHRWKVEAHQRYRLEPEVLDDLARLIAADTLSTRWLLRGAGLPTTPVKPTPLARAAPAIDFPPKDGGETEDLAAEREAEAEAERRGVEARRRS